MEVKWKKLLFRVGFWFAMEVFFSYAGVDTIADYGEFIFERHAITLNL